jgi:hypothetical protein
MGELRFSQRCCCDAKPCRLVSTCSYRRVTTRVTEDTSFLGCYAVRTCRRVVVPPSSSSRIPCTSLSRLDHEDEGATVLLSFDDCFSSRHYGMCLASRIFLIKYTLEAVDVPCRHKYGGSETLIKLQATLLNNTNEMTYSAGVLSSVTVFFLLFFLLYDLIPLLPFLLLPLLSPFRSFSSSCCRNC